jgi:hypothetical protein
VDPQVNDAGYAAKQAAALQDNLAGDLEKLGGSFDTLMISIGHGVQGPLRGLTEMVTGLLNGAGSLVGVFAGLPGPVQAAVLGFGAWAVAGDRVTGMFGKVRDGMRAFTETQELQRALLSAQNSTLSDTERALGGLGTQLDNTAGKFGLTKAAIGSFAKAIGPELGVAAAVYGISSVASSLEGSCTPGTRPRRGARPQPVPGRHRQQRRPHRRHRPGDHRPDPQAGRREGAAGTPATCRRYR